MLATIPQVLNPLPTAQLLQSMNFLSLGSSGRRSAATGHKASPYLHCTDAGAGRYTDFPGGSYFTPQPTSKYEIRLG